jgi:hypothetical protein
LCLRGGNNFENLIKICQFAALKMKYVGNFFKGK